MQFSRTNIGHPLSADYLSRLSGDSDEAYIFYQSTPGRLLSMEWLNNQLPLDEVASKLSRALGKGRNATVVIDLSEDARTVPDVVQTLSEVNESHPVLQTSIVCKSL